MPSPNPLTRTTPLIHLPLIVLATLFALPLLWLLLTAVQPREQVGKIPPEWLPRQSYIKVGSETVPVTPPVPVGSDKLVVVPSAGPKRGTHLLVEPADFRNGQLEAAHPSRRSHRRSELPGSARADGPRALRDRQRVVLVEIQRAARRACFTSSRAPSSAQISPVFGNYPEAVRALTASEKDKARPLGELLGQVLAALDAQGRPHARPSLFSPT